MPKKSHRRSKKSSPTVRRTGMVAGLLLVFVSLAAAYQSAPGQYIVRSIQNGSAFHQVAAKLPDMDDEHDADETKGLKPEDEDRGGDDSLKFKKRAYDFRAYPNKTIPAGSREKAWEQFQAHYPPSAKKSWWDPAKRVDK